MSEVIFYECSGHVANLNAIKQITEVVETEKILRHA
jgi:hypothetical protein